LSDETRIMRVILEYMFQAEVQTPFQATLYSRDAD